MKWSTPALAVALVAAPLGMGSTAHAAEEIGLSHDGSTWSDSLTMPLFEAGMLWVPGDEQTVSFFVRNQGPGDAALTVEVRPTDTDSLLADEHIALAVRTEGGAWQDVRNGDPVSVRMPADLAVAEAAEVDLHAVFDTASSNDSQRSELSMDVVVTLSGDTSDDADDGDEPPGAPGELPSTGLIGPWVLLWCVAALLIIGLGVRRRIAEEVTGG